jgi:hypothetical protein
MRRKPERGLPQPRQTGKIFGLAKTCHITSASSPTARSNPMTSDHEVRALIEKLRKGCNCGKCRFDACCCSELDEAATALEALLAERDQDEPQRELARVRAYQAGLSDGADADRARAVAWLYAYAETVAQMHTVVPSFLKGAADALARNEHRGKDDAI